MNGANGHSDEGRPIICAADSAGLGRAVALLTAGEPVALPTETVYGLAARADSDKAVAAIYAAKGRPAFNPLIVHVRDHEAAERLAICNGEARALAGAFWPGPLTLVSPLRPDAELAPAVSAGLPTVALRSPAHPVMQAVLARCPFPLAAPSANRSGGVSPTTADHVARSLAGRIPLVVEGGATMRGLESTIVACEDRGWRILRPGPVSADEIARVVGRGPLATPTNAGIEAPGQLESHYAPGKPLRLRASVAEPDEFLIGFGPVPGDVNLSASGDLFEAAARLYACLHFAAASRQPRIAVAPIPDHGIGVAINDRLRRAAA